MILSLDTEKGFDKTQILFMIKMKNLNQPGIDGNFLCWVFVD